MSTLLKNDYYCTPEEYLVAERVAEQKHEYLAGVIYAMAGATVRHSFIVGNIYAELRHQLRGKACAAFMLDLKVRIRRCEAEFYYYPDIAVDFSPLSLTAHYAEEPRLLFEVLAPDTERIDRGEKLQNYQSLPSLQAYVLVDQAKLAVTIYRRIGESWEIEFFHRPDDILRLPEIECELSLSAIYERTEILA